MEMALFLGMAPTQPYGDRTVNGTRLGRSPFLCSRGVFDVAQQRVRVYPELPPCEADLRGNGKVQVYGEAARVASAAGVAHLAQLLSGGNPRCEHVYRGFACASRMANIWEDVARQIILSLQKTHILPVDYQLRR